MRAAGPSQIWRIDVSVLKLLDGTKAYLHAIIDNYSRKILAWTVTERLEPTATCQLLLAAGKHMVFAGLPLLFADSGVENVNAAVDATLSSACLERVGYQFFRARGDGPHVFRRSDFGTRRGAVLSHSVRDMLL